MLKIRFTLVIIFATFLANTAYADTTFTWEFTVKDKNTGAPLNAIPVSCDFVDRKDGGKSSKNECITDANGQCSIVNKGNGGFFSSSNMQASCKPATTGYKSEFRSTTKSMSDGATFLMEMTPVTAEELLEAERKLQLEKDSAILLAKKVEKEKLETAALNLKKQEEADEIAKLKALHRAEIESKKDVSIFGVVMGLSTMEDIAAIPDVSNGDALCKVDVKRCKLTADNIKYSGEIGETHFFSNEKISKLEIDEIDSHYDVAISLKFIEFAIGSQNFSAALYEGVVVELRVRSSTYSDKIDKELIKELRLSFDKKYLKQKNTQRKDVEKSMIRTITYENWKHPQGAVEIQITDKRKTLTVHESVCLNSTFLVALRAMGESVASSEWDCYKATDNVPIYMLNYRYPTGYQGALKKIMNNRAMTSAAKKKRVDENTSKF